MEKTLILLEIKMKQKSNQKKYSDRKRTKRDLFTTQISKYKSKMHYFTPTNIINMQIMELDPNSLVTLIQ